MDFRKRVGDDRFADVAFADLQTDPVQTLEATYTSLGLTFTDVTVAAGFTRFSTVASTPFNNVFEVRK